MAPVSKIFHYNKIFYKNRNDVRSNNLKGVMVTVMFTLSIGLTALMFVMEKKEGLFDRSLVAGVSTIEIM
jgi:hypothetical protein